MKVFISHQKSDRDAAKKIADYLITVGIDVYFDEFDRELQQADAASSKWVPFEVGYGYDATDLATLTLKGIKNSELPDYIKTKPIIRDIYDINKFVDKQGKGYILKQKSFDSTNSMYHPLINVMDSIITT